MHDKPNLDDPAEAWAHRIMEHLQALEPDTNNQFPRFVVVVEAPPEGDVFALQPRIGRMGLAPEGEDTESLGLATSADDAIDAHRLLVLAAAAVRNGMDPDTKARARAMWDQAEADFRARTA